MNLDVEFEQEDDGHWIAEISEIPGVLAYGVTPLQAGTRVRALALRVLADRMENEELYHSLQMGLDQINNGDVIEEEKMMGILNNYIGI